MLRTEKLMTIKMPILVLAVLLAGCEPAANPFRPARAPPPEPVRTGNDPTQDRIDLLEQRVKELSARCIRLQEEAKKLEFQNEQLRLQLDVVGAAPRQRDRYKLALAEQELELQRACRRIAELEARLNIPPEQRTGPPASRAVDDTGPASATAPAR